ncbi:thioredoxin [Ligilactobacillus salivarius]|uniref:thioredoxin n=1 Tax=Ligilactobacillus salivarius TaxID=1624 RepID=UPI003D00E9FB
MNFLNKYLTKKNLVIWGIAQTISLIFCLFAFWFGYSFFYGRYQQQPLNQNVYSKIVQERNYNLVFYKKGCPYCQSAEKKVISESKKSSIPTIFINVEDPKGKSLVAQYHVNRPATAISVRKDSVNTYIYATKVNGKIRANVGTIKQMFTK